MIGARTAQARVGGDTVLFENALDGGATVLHVPSSSGTEEYTRFATRPASRLLRHEVETTGIAGLRLIGSVLEFLDDGGNPVFRTHAPWVIDANGEFRRGTIAVENCAVDTNGAPPWGRPTTPMGNPRCVVAVSWNDDGLKYPLLVDPAWTTTASMAQKRTSHAASLVTKGTACASGCVLATGGYFSAALNNVELYNASTKTWAAMPDMPGGARYGHASVTLTDGCVLIAGGNGTATTAIFDPTASPVWKALGDLPGGARFGSGVAHVRYFDDAKRPAAGYWDLVYVVGGRDAGSTRFAAVDVLDVDTGTWSAAPPLTTGRFGAAVAGWVRSCSPTPCYEQHFVVAAGGTDASGATSSVEVLSNGYSWAPGGALSVARSDAVAVETADKILIGGGIDSVGPSAAVDVINKSTPLTTTAFPTTLSQPRVSHAGALSGTGTNAHPIFIGGSFVTGPGGLFDTDDADMFDTTSNVRAVTKLLGPRTRHQATALPDGSVLVSGGMYRACPTSGCSYVSTYYPANDEIFAPMAKGAACTTRADCSSFNCVDGVCCDTACLGQCQACNLPSAVGTCTTVTKTNGPSGYPAGQSVTNSTTTRPACPGYGSVCGSACDGTSATSCTYASTTTTCGVASCMAGVETLVATCSGSGACSTAVTNTCGKFACGATACRTTCTANADCASGYRCVAGDCVAVGTVGQVCKTEAGDCASGLTCVDGVCCSTASCPDGYSCNVPGDPGTCRIVSGHVCGVAGFPVGDCVAGRCIDGVCCESSCNGQCEACDLPTLEGKCSPVVGRPHGTRTACSDGAGDVCKALECNGVEDRTKCTKLAGAETVCGAASCKDGTATEATTCDGKGVCNPARTTSCGAYACGTNACKTSCATSADCGGNAVCDQATQKCVAVTATCSADETKSQPLDRSDPKPCAPYRCNVSTGDCFTACTTSAQCASGSLCDGTSCVAAPESSESSGGDCGCEVGPGKQSPRGAPEALAIALMAALLTLRRRSNRVM